MPDFTSNLKLPYLMPTQAQKHVTVNEALRTLDALAQASVESATLTAEPTAPQDGACYILPPGKTGSTWATYATGAIAYWRDGIWQEITPQTGWRVAIKDSGEVVSRRGSVWRSLSRGENLLLNASFAIHQRATTSVADGGYGLDRWLVATEGGTVTIARQALTGGPSSHAVQLTQPDATPKRIALAQIVEHAMSRPLAGKACAFTVMVNPAATMTLRIAILAHTATPDVVTHAPIANWSTGALASNLTLVASSDVTAQAGTWTALGPISGKLPSGTANIVVVVRALDPMAQNASVSFAAAQAEAGSFVGGFFPRQITEDLVLCRRMYEKGGFAQDGAPSAGQSSLVLTAAAWAPVYALAGVRFTVPKRAAPTVQLRRGAFQSGNDGFWNYLTPGQIWMNATSSDATRITTDGFDVDVGGSFTSNHALLMNGGWIADAEL